ncbi:MAG: redoxin domain-containing protein [Acidobacteria bacterium]|nr:redoxin domain-containing protein [Acidobacteriota bacterium]
MPHTPRPAPEWEIDEWLNTEAPITISGCRGRVVAAFAFQMLCPGCVQLSIPQAAKAYRRFDPGDVMVVGLHTVFEHHAAMTKTALTAFLHEYRVPFPVGIDRPSPDQPIPATMHRYAMQGTPTLLLIDRQGHLRLQRFGHVDDLELGAMLGRLIAET